MKRPLKRYAALSLVPLILMAGGCSSSSPYVRTEVINNSDRSLKTPDWVLSSKTLLEENGQVIYIHKVSLDGSARPDACVNIAKSQAVAEMLKFIQNAVTASGQTEDVNTSSDPSYSALTAFLAQGRLSGAQATESYWEQTMEGDASGMHPVKRLLCAVKVGISKQVLDKQVKDVINGTPGGNPEIRRKLLDAQKQFLDNVTPMPKTPEVAP